MLFMSRSLHAPLKGSVEISRLERHFCSLLQGSKNRPPSGHLRLKNPVWRVKNPFSGQFGDWKLPFSGQVGDQTFFKVDNAGAAGPNVIVEGAWQSLSVQDARELAVRAPSIVFVSKSNPRGRGAFPEILLSRPSELSGAEKISYAFWLSVCSAHQSSTWVFFSSGLSGESAKEEEKDEFEEEGSKEDGEKAPAGRRKAPKSQYNVLQSHEDNLPLWLRVKPINQTITTSKTHQ